MKTALITTVFNEGDNILSFLNSYKRQTRYANEFIILDGGSGDNTVELIENYSLDNPELNINVIVDNTCNKKHSKGPIAKGRNVAISNTDCELIAVTDAGCILKDDWLEKILVPFFEENASVVCGYYEVLIKSDFDKKYACVFVPDNHEFLPSSRSLAFKRECWETVGGYPEDSYTAEDTYFDIKLLKKYKIHRAPDAIVYWSFARDEEDLKRKLIAYGRGEGRLLLYKRRNLFRFVSLLFPVYPLLHKHGFATSYKFYFYQTKGYIYGIIDRLKYDA